MVKVVTSLIHVFGLFCFFALIDEVLVIEGKVKVVALMNHPCVPMMFLFLFWIVKSCMRVGDLCTRSIFLENAYVLLRRVA